MKQLKGVNGKLDKAWSKLVKLVAGYKCEYCHTKSKRLESHHIFSRSNRSVRWSIENGVCLCTAHHVFSSSFSAHKTPVEFTRWLDQYKGRPFMDTLSIKAKSICKMKTFEKELLLIELNKQIKEYESQ